LITDTGRTETEQVRITFCAWVLNYCVGGVHFLRMGFGFAHLPISSQRTGATVSRWFDWGAA
jgi:hypothetical protein